MARLSRYLYLSIVSTHLVEVRGGQRASGWISDVPSAVQFSPAWRLHSVASLARTAAVPLPYLYFRRHFICGNARAATRRGRSNVSPAFSSIFLLNLVYSCLRTLAVLRMTKSLYPKKNGLSRHSTLDVVTGSSGDLQFCICS
jgi:hypothetical protein